MEKLQDTHPHVHSKFIDGFFVLRRTENYWAGIYSDLYIEQVLKRDVKAVGGLTRGRGFDQTTSLVLLLSTTACAEVNRAMRDVTGLQDTNTSDEEVHKDQRLGWPGMPRMCRRFFTTSLNENLSQRIQKSCVVCHLESWQTNL